MPQSQPSECQDGMWTLPCQAVQFAMCKHYLCSNVDLEGPEPAVLLREGKISFRGGPTRKMLGLQESTHSGDSSVTVTFCLSVASWPPW